ncbi:MAG: ABC transporter permease [Crocinitomicaceae bacterium]|nr:ABC transporter permease [Crocinitomicaceae bacterium]
MKNSWRIAVREFRERIGTRSFILLSILGPIIVLGLVYVLFAIGGQSKQHWNVLVADKYSILDNKIMAQEDRSVTYFFANDYIETDDFQLGKKYQKYDALLEVNEKVLSNKTSFVFFREKPSLRMQTRVQYQFERRLEEVMVKEFTKLSVKEFRQIKQPINVEFRDVTDPEGIVSNVSGWAGFFFGTLIFVFIFLFGMTILRSVTREKTNRIVEVLLASVSPNQLMVGKIVGIGLSAFLQFVIWIALIGFGLYFMREALFPDMLDAAKMNVHELTLNANDVSYAENYFAAREYNEFVDLIYKQVQYTNTISFFILFFIAGYLFYGAVFAALGATMGSESDGQQFVIPLIIVLCLALYAGYYVLNYPEGELTSLFHYMPFTAPVVVMVRLFQGYYVAGNVYEIYMTLLVLIASALGMLAIASRLYKNGILQFGHRLKIKHFFKWMKNT